MPLLSKPLKFNKHGYNRCTINVVPIKPPQIDPLKIASKPVTNQVTNQVGNLVRNLVSNRLGNQVPNQVMSQLNIRNQQRGFTLIEVMVALAILALVSLVASQTSFTYLKSVENLKTRTLAHFVAQNSASNLQINPQWPVTTQVNQVSAQGRHWQVSITPIVINEAFGSSGLDSSSVQESLQPVSIQVAPIDSETSEVQHVITDLTVVVSQNEDTSQF